MPAHPTARWYNTILGHLIGLILGFIVVAVLNVGDHPVLMNDLALTMGRTWAAVLAIALTFLIAKLFNASHPPAGANYIIGSLGFHKDC